MGPADAIPRLLAKGRLQLDGVLRLADLGHHAVLDEDRVPQHKDQHGPQPAAVVAAAAPVLVEHAIHGGDVNQVTGLRRAHRRIRPLQQLAGTQPMPDRDREPELGPVQHVCGHNRLQRAAARTWWWYG